MSNVNTVKFFSDKLFEDLENNKKNKIVTIWGAGASVNSGIPSGYYLMQRMKKDLDCIKESSYFRDSLGDKYKEVKDNFNFNRELSFEYVMWIYNKIYGHEKLHSWLKEYIPTLSRDKLPPYFPVFTHEYCSHLAKNGYLKYFISTNFDEILENTLEDELQPGNFTVIASESEFERLKNVDIDSWEHEYRATKENCFVLKPHGTISRGLTLKDTPDKVSYFEINKKEVLLKVFKDAIIVFLGFGNYNENFWLLFGESYSMGQTRDIIIVDKNVKNVKQNLPDPRINSKIYEYQGELDEFFKDVLNEHNNLIKENKLPRQKPTRHFIRCMFFDLFSRKLTTIVDENTFIAEIEKIVNAHERWWYDLRIYELELIIYLLKSRGLFIQLTLADCPRVKAAYRKCLEWKIKNQNKLEELNKLYSKNKNVLKVIKKIKDEEITDKNLEPTEILKEILNKKNEELFSVGYIKDRANKNAFNYYWCSLLIPPSLNYIDKSISKKRNTDSESFNKAYLPYFKKISQSYYEHLVNKFSGNTKINDPGKFKKILTEQLIELYSDFDTDFVKDISTQIRFDSPIPLTNRIMFDEETDRILQADGNILKVSTTSAEWLAKKIEKFYSRNKDVKKNIVILSNLDMFKEMDKKDINSTKIYPDTLFHYKQMIYKIVTLIRQINWDKISKIEWYAIKNLQHHITLICKSEKKVETGIKAIYFRRAGKSAQISPVYLDNKDDIFSLNNYFDERTKKLSDPNQGGLLFEVTGVSNPKHCKIDINKTNKVLSKNEVQILNDLFKLWA